MVWGIILYYIWIFVALYLWWALFFCAYHTADNSRKGYKAGDKKRFPIWAVALGFMLAFVPGINIVGCSVVAAIAMPALSEEEDVEFRSILFKSI